MKLVPWKRSPMALLGSDLEDMMRTAFDERGFFARLPEALRRGPLPVVNLADAEKEFIATIELPGMEEKDIDVQILGQQLVIAGERRFEEEKRDREFYRIESEYGAFRRAIELPEGLNLDPDAVRASYSKGVLEVRIPKTEPRPATKIKVKGNNK